MEQKDGAEFRLCAVGVVRAGKRFQEWQTGHDQTGRLQDSEHQISRVVIRPGLEGILDGIEDFSHLLIIYWPHLIAENQRRRCRVRPMQRRDMPVKGIFATCSPVRPNPVLVSVVKLVDRKGRELTVRGLDALDGSPVLDVKPYVESLYSRSGCRVPAWMERISAGYGS